MTPTYRVYDHRLFFNCRRRGQIRLTITPAGCLAIRACDVGWVSVSPVRVAGVVKLIATSPACAVAIHVGAGGD